MPATTEGVTGGGGSRLAIWDSGIMNAVVPFLNRMVYRRSVQSLDDAEASIEKRISMTVLERSMLVTGSTRSTLVPGGYFSSK